MRSALVSLLALCGAAIAGRPGSLDELFVGCEQVQRRAESLVVEFHLEAKELGFNTREAAADVFRLVRSPTRELYAITPERPTGETKGRWSGLLNGGRMYLLDPDKRTAIRFAAPAADELPQFLETYSNPFAVLLDRTRADAKNRLELVKQDEWYTYVTVTPRQVKRNGWQPDRFHEGRAVFMAKDSQAVPKEMPRQLWYTDGTSEHVFDIKAWRLNPDDGPKVEEFTKPEDRPGWEVVDWPLQGKQ